MGGELTGRSWAPLLRLLEEVEDHDEFYARILFGPQQHDSLIVGTRIVEVVTFGDSQPPKSFAERNPTARSSLEKGPVLCPNISTFLSRVGNHDFFQYARNTHFPTAT